MYADIYNKQGYSQYMKEVLHFFFFAVGGVQKIKQKKTQLQYFVTKFKIYRPRDHY